MISEKYADMTTKGSIIREFAQYASKRAAEIGKENVYNFTIGNPSVPVCPEFTETLERMLKEENPLTLHGQPDTWYYVRQRSGCRFFKQKIWNGIYSR